MGDLEEDLIKGQEIEVGNDDEGFEGSWYAAKVVQTPLTKKKKLLVEYMTLMDDVQSSKPLQEYVDTYIVRPRPPQEEERLFELGELVEAYHNDGWWEGTITQVLHDNLKYRVNLRASVEELEFQHSEIRNHHQWIGGRWVGAQELEISPQGRIEAPGQVKSVEARKTDQNIDMASRCGEDAAKNVSNEKSSGQVHSGDAGKTDQNIDMASRCGEDAAKNVGIEKSSEQAQQQAGNQSNPSKLGSPGHRQSHQAESSDQIIDMAVTPSGNATKTVVAKKSPSFRNLRKVDNQSTPDKVNSASYTINSCKKRKMQSTSESDTDSINSSKKKKIQSTSSSDTSSIITREKRKKMQSTPENDTVPSRTCKKLKTAEAVKTPLAPIACRARAMATRVLTETDGQLDFATQTTEVQGANVGGKSSSESIEVKRAESPILAEVVLNSSKEGYKDHPNDLNSGQEQLKHVLESNGSRNQSSIEGSSHLPQNVIDVEQYEVVNLPRIQVPARPMKLRIRPMRQKGEPLARDDIKQETTKGGSKQTSNVSNRKTRAMVSITKALVKDVGHSETVGRLQAPVLTSGDHNTAREGSQAIETQTKGPEETTPSKEITNFVVQREDATKETDMDGASSDIRDLHQPPIHYLKDSPIVGSELRNSLNVDVSSFSVEGAAANTLLDQEIGDEVSERTQQSSLISSNADQMLLEDESFPFIKCSPAWEFVESWEVFRVMPQRLHFRPLEQFDMDLREGLAIGSMVNFANIVEKVGKTTLDDPLSILQDRSKVLENFKAHGFNVQAIQARLGTLLKIKDEQAKLNDDLMEVEDQFNMKLADKISREKELDELNKKMRELQECLNQLSKKRELTVLENEVQDSSMAELKKTIDNVRGCMHSVTSEFRTVVATPW